jgi:hypothetical protein
MNFRKNQALLRIVWSLRFSNFLAQVLAMFIRTGRNVGYAQTVRARSWMKSGFASPAPNFVKWEVLSRWGSDGTWIETGTYLGETTEFLSRTSALVISLEPSRELAELAIGKFINQEKVRIVQGTSEECLEQVLEKLSNNEIEEINFWLDGHYSAGFTFLGKNSCPIKFELRAIESRIKDFGKLTIFVDDVRVFSEMNSRDKDYPTLSYLVKWADKQSLSWTIEHDIFVMTNAF